MPVMYPTRISKDVKSEAEKILFEQFQCQLNEDYSVIHSKNWIMPKQGGRQGKEGECDFIVLHAQRGILFIEAKSGKSFYYNGDNADWYREESAPIQNPIEQVKKSQWALINFLKEKIGDVKLPYDHAIAFPHADQISGDLPPEIRAEKIILKPDLKNLQEKINQSLMVMRDPLPEPLHTSEFSRIVRTLISNFGITSSISTRLISIREQFFRLENDQVEVLDIFEKNNRVLVDGCSGSGKTLIAIEKARRLSNDNKSVLLLCYNIPLSIKIRQRTADQNINVDVYHFHGLCEKVITEIDGFFVDDKNNSNEYWDHTYPMRLFSKLPFYRKRYDAIIVDEGQDFLNDWWNTIKGLLKDPENGILYVFQDVQQNIFMRPAAKKICDQNISLNKNYRNTPAIIEWVNKQCETNISYSNQVDHGIEPQVIYTKDDQEEIKKISETIDQIIRETNLSPGQIVILGKHPFWASLFGKNKKLGRYSIVEDPISIENSDEIQYSSIYRFKGLEADCIILTGINKESRKDIIEGMHAILLTAATRAKMLLYVFLRKI
jgi:hypothetical protein